MKPYNNKGFAGVYAIDELQQVPVKSDSRVGFIMNLDKSYQPGSHWVAVYIDARPQGDHSVEYYDSFGEEPPKSFMKDIFKIVQKIKPDVFMKLKVNKIIQQRANTGNCGFFASKFLIDRMNGKPFKECSGYSDANRGEKDIKSFKKKFGYI